LADLDEKTEVTEEATEEKEVIEPSEEVKSQEQVQQEKEKAAARKRLSGRLKTETFLRREAEQEKERLAREVQQLREQSKLKEEPREDKYEDYEQFKADQEKWKAQEKERLRIEVQEELRAEQEQQSQEKAAMKAQENWGKQKQYGIKTFENFEEKEKLIIDTVATYGAIEIRDTILESEDKGAALVNHLGENPDLLEEIALLPPKSQARKLLRIEAQLEAKPTKKISSAPSPAKGLEGSASGTPKANGSKYLRKKGESMSDYSKRINGF